jgi:hypothetical protein
MNVQREDRERTAFHEAGHGVVAHALGRRIELLSIRPGAHYAGIAPYVAPRLPSNGKLHRPAILQDASFRRSVETRACVALAGNLAEEFAGPTRHRRWSDERTARKAVSKLAELSQRESESLERLERAEEPFPTDDQVAKDMSWILSGEQGLAHLIYLREVTRTILHSHRRAVVSLAEALLSKEVVSGRGAREILTAALERRS